MSSVPILSSPSNIPSPKSIFIPYDPVRPRLVTQPIYLEVFRLRVYYQSMDMFNMWERWMRKIWPRSRPCALYEHDALICTRAGDAEGLGLCGGWICTPTDTGTCFGQTCPSLSNDQLCNIEQSRREASRTTKRIGNDTLVYIPRASQPIYFWFQSSSRLVLHQHYKSQLGSLAIRCSRC